MRTEAEICAMVKRLRAAHKHPRVQADPPIADIIAGQSAILAWALGAEDEVTWELDELMAKLASEMT